MFNHLGGFTGACGGSTSGDMVEFIFVGFNSLFEGVDVPVDCSMTVDGEDAENTAYEFSASMNLLVYLDSLYSVRALLWQVVHFL